MSTLMKAPPTITDKIIFRDGSSQNLDANGYIACPANFVADMLNAGFVSLFPGSSNAILTVKYTAMTDTAAAVVTATSMSAESATVEMSGTLGAGATLTLPTVAQFVAAVPEAQAGQSFRLRVINSGAGAFAWTLTTATGWGTLGGTMTIAQNTWRDFYVTLTSLTAGTIRQVGTGTNS